MTATFYLKPSRMRAPLRRHPWVYGNSVAKVEGAYADGDAVEVRGVDGRFLAHAFVNDRSRLRLRLVSFEREAPLEPELLRARVAEAVRLRHDVLRLPERTTAYRVIHSEGDGLPGLIVDRYGDVLALSSTCLGTDLRLAPILDELEALLGPRAIIERGASPAMREREALPPERGLLRGALPEGPVVVTIDGVALRVPLEGQKTGLFLDQRENVRRVAALARGRRVLDLCSYVGPFGIAAALSGATGCLLVDSSAGALAEAASNAAANGVSDRVETRRGSLFAAARELAEAGERFDLVVLDPPKFAKKGKDRDAARRGYLEANQLALRLLAPGALLLTCSCSHHVDLEALEEVVRDAATRAEVRLKVLDRTGPGADHPVDVHCPEGRYLKALLVQRGEAPAGRGPSA
jgi:23S rRNA (cytosine1962-C5)-methyltransferase